MTKVLWSEMERLIKEGLSGYEIARRLGLNSQSVYNRLWRRGIHLKTNRVNLEKEEIIKLYSGGLTLKEIAKKYGCSVKPVYNLIRGAGKSRKRGQRRYVKLDDGYFEKIDSAEKAYWLGMLVTDGCIHTAKYQKVIDLTVARRDEDLIEKFVDALGFTGKVYKTKDKIGIKIASRKMYADLVKRGLYERKSLKIGELDVCDKFKWDFWRGCIDGDGFITYSGSKKYPCIGLCGSKKICDDLTRFLWGKGVAKRKIVYSTGSWTARYAGEDFWKIVVPMYQRKPWLKRKKEKIDNILCRKVVDMLPI